MSTPLTTARRVEIPHGEDATPITKSICVDRSRATIGEVKTESRFWIRYLLFGYKELEHRFDGVAFEPRGPV